MSVLTDVIRETATGATAPVVARRLRLDEGLVRTALDHAERVGLVIRPGCGACASPSTPTAARPPACAGCPLARS